MTHRCQDKAGVRVYRVGYFFFSEVTLVVFKGEPRGLPELLIYLRPVCFLKIFRHCMRVYLKVIVNTLLGENFSRTLPVWSDVSVREAKMGCVAYFGSRLTTLLIL